jgi:hypothetical protein
MNGCCPGSPHFEDSSGEGIREGAGAESHWRGGRLSDPCAHAALRDGSCAQAGAWGWDSMEPPYARAPAGGSCPSFGCWVAEELSVRLARSIRSRDRAQSQGNARICLRRTHLASVEDGDSSCDRIGIGRPYPGRPSLDSVEP